jgi:succinyl-CoA synthetase beta subunit
MLLLEHQARTILRDTDVVVPFGVVVDEQTDVPVLPCVLKVQVPVGGRGKAGGIRVVNEEKEYRDALEELTELDIKGHKPSAIYAEELVDIGRELYLSIVINREESTIELVAHPEGGVEIEAHKPEEFMRAELTPKSLEAVGQAAADWLEIPEQAFVLTDMVERLYGVFVKSDATLLEINPLALTREGKLVVADCKLELDDMARYRHEEWPDEQTPADVNYVPLDSDGTIGTIANGAGLAMATVDAVRAHGYTPANFLDIGGAATTESVAASLQKISSLPNIEAIVINIFGGIVRCDIVAQAIIEASRQVDNPPRLVVRLSGTNAEEARKLLSEHDMPLHDSLAEALEAL